MHNSCLFLLKCQLMKTYLKGSIPREAQAAGRDGMQSHTVSCHTETQGSSDGPLHSPAATYSFSLGARPGGASAVTLLTHLPQRKGFTFVPELNLAKTLPVWGVHSQHGWWGGQNFAGQGCCGCRDVAKDAGRQCSLILPVSLPTPSHLHKRLTLGKGGKNKKREKWIISKETQTYEGQFFFAVNTHKETKIGSFWGKEMRLNFWASEKVLKSPATPSSSEVTSVLGKNISEDILFFRRCQKCKTWHFNKTEKGKHIIFLTSKSLSPGSHCCHIIKSDVMQ